MISLAQEGAERVYHAPPSSYAKQVRARLEMGEGRYQGSFVEKDCLGEALCEPPDTTAWLLLWLQQQRPLMREEDFQVLAQGALPAMSTAAASFAALLELRKLRSELH